MLEGCKLVRSPNLHPFIWPQTLKLKQLAYIESGGGGVSQLGVFSTPNIIAGYI